MDSKRIFNKEGLKIGKLTILKKLKNKRGKSTLYLCQCECGKITEKRNENIKTNSSCGCAKGHNIKNEIGKTYGYLFVIEKVRNPKNLKQSAEWICKCICGNKTIVVGNHLRKGIKQSCGCKRYESVSKKLLKDITITAINRIFNSYKNAAKNRNINFELTKDEFYNLCKSNCHFCNEIPSNILNLNNYKRSFLYSGIDRVNSKEGYTLKNSVACCIKCNVSKLDYSKEDFLNWIKKVYKYNFGENNG